MTKVITYGTFDNLHYGHINLLKRAKALGDYLIVGVTSDIFDRERGKINVQQSLLERVEAVKNLHIADEIIVEEYQGQKVEDIKKYAIDIFTVGSDWKGYFDYLNRYCKVVYLPRTQGISSTEIRTEQHQISIGFIGCDANILRKYYQESKYINGMTVSGICVPEELCSNFSYEEVRLYKSYEELLSHSDAIYLISKPEDHFEMIQKAIFRGKHVLCESPIVLDENQYHYLNQLAKDHHVILMDAIKTAYSVAYNHMLYLAQSNHIGAIVSIDATCTSLHPNAEGWNSITAWGPTAVLPIYQLLGEKYETKKITSWLINEDSDGFTNVTYRYKNAVASLKVGNRVKSEGELIISGTKGYIYVPSPWWKMDYFEIRYENQAENQRYFYKLEGEGVRNTLAVFSHSICMRKDSGYIDEAISSSICKLMEDFHHRIDFVYLSI